MKGLKASFGRISVNIGLFAYKALVLTFFIRFLIRFLVSDGGWINEFIIFLILFSLFALGLFIQRLQLKQLKEPER